LKAAAPNYSLFASLRANYYSLTHVATKCKVNHTPNPEGYIVVPLINLFHQMFQFNFFISSYIYS